MNGILICSGASGLNLLSFNSFSQVATSGFVKLGVAFTPAAVQVIGTGTGSYYNQFIYRFFITGGGVVLPAWIQPGAGVQITASVTVAGASYDVSGFYVVRDVDTVAGTYFDVNVQVAGGTTSAGFSIPVAKTNVDSGSGAQPTPLISLNIQCQKAMLQASAGTVIIAPSVDFNGAAPITETLVAGQGEYEITAPTGAKFDLADWSMKWSGSGTLAVRFI